ncbi:TonB-dependent receptor [Caulobacter sp. NIBR1757]|uniref:TonB-dependent receptor n=1 Tax=Caulobacter sp. NIBR1757 TaxID=3016000 RepID=UPI0022F05100|nr:TonB-dependent receptor [Caulobacter sp. NIBR1757]WGM38150.1 Vitamin B12 transporter BtuB [Caulobacter sp. NIBR1757]
MRRTAYLAGGSALAMAAAIGFGGIAFAQDEPAQVEEVVITGSLLAGTPEDAALPVDVIGAEELAKQGSPSTVELLKGLSVSNGVLGDTNQFDARAQGSEGSGSVNLRGLGPTRTLVLLNGRRMPINPFALAGAGAVDTNIIPSAAIGRVEVLKDGAAATYGSDAIAGVVNFITKKGQEGGELGASYKLVDGSDGDWTANASWGWSSDASDAFVAFGYQHRSELSVTERDFANRGYLENPEGGWTAAGSPSTFVPLAANTTGFRDSNCSALGGFAGFSGATPVCYAHYIEFDNLVEREERFQLYGEFNHEFNDTTKLHIEGLYASTDVPEWKTSPSYALLATPTATTSPVPGRYYIPGTNPGLQRYIIDNPTLGNYSLGTGLCSTGAAQNPCVGANSAILAAGVLNVANRPHLLGGNPMFDYGASRGSRNFEAYRLSAELSGQFTDDLNWQISATYGEERGNRTGYDTIVGRYQLALRGLGGANCNGIVAGGVGSTCQYFNPFSSAIPGAPDYDPALANDPDLTRWFFQKLETEQKTGMFVAEALISGKMFTLGGGDAAWAVGGQYRRSTFDVWYNDISNRAINPCLDTPINGSKTCAAPSGPFAFLGVGSNAYVEQSTWSGFGELSLPFTDNFNVSLAARYESIEDVGETFNPKISAKWQIIEPLAVRASLGTTFRAPVPSQLTTDFVTSLQSINGTFRAVDIYGDPDLEPETATTYNIGVILELGGFKASLDYFNFDFQDPITTEPVSGLVAQVFPNGIGAGQMANCASPFASRFSFSGGATCASFASASAASTAITRVSTNTINGAGVQTSGIDLMADYTFDDVGGGSLTIGGNATYVLEYVTDDLKIAGVVLSKSFDAVGLLNYQTTAYPLPQWKGSLYLEYNNGPHNARVTVRHIDGYTDQRVSPFAAGTYFTDSGIRTAAPANKNGKNIDSFTTFDVTYRAFLPWDSTLALSVDNIMDEDPPFARLDLSYDPFTASGLGRTFKFSLSKKF